VLTTCAAAIAWSVSPSNDNNTTTCHIRERASKSAPATKPVQHSNRYPVAHWQPVASGQHTKGETCSANAHDLFDTCDNIHMACRHTHTMQMASCSHCSALRT
jgi:hypothetical protein